MRQHLVVRIADIPCQASNKIELLALWKKLKTDIRYAIVIVNWSLRFHMVQASNVWQRSFMQQMFLEIVIVFTKMWYLWAGQTDRKNTWNRLHPLQGVMTAVIARTDATYAYGD